MTQVQTRVRSLKVAYFMHLQLILIEAFSNGFYDNENLLTTSPTLICEHFFSCGKIAPLLQMAVKAMLSPSVSPNTSSSISDRSA